MTVMMKLMYVDDGADNGLALMTMVRMIKMMINMTVMMLIMIFRR